MKKVVSEHRGYKQDLQRWAEEAIEELLENVPEFINGKVTLVIEKIEEPNKEGIL